jgi:hypothetical protein
VTKLRSSSSSSSCIEQVGGAVLRAGQPLDDARRHLGRLGDPGGTGPVDEQPADGAGGAEGCRPGLARAGPLGSRRPGVLRPQQRAAGRPRRTAGAGRCPGSAHRRGAGCAPAGRPARRRCGSTPPTSRPTGSSRGPRPAVPRSGGRSRPAARTRLRAAAPGTWPWSRSRSGRAARRPVPPVAVRTVGSRPPRRRGRAGAPSSTAVERRSWITCDRKGDRDSATGVLDRCSRTAEGACSQTACRNGTASERRPCGPPPSLTCLQ